jgi:hypothetical protein
VIRCRRGRVAAFLAVGVVACQGAGVPTSEIPEEPIALVYRDPESARRRAETLLDEESPEQSRAGVAQVGNIADYVADRSRIGPVDAEGRYPGQLAFLHPRSGDVDLQEYARRGAIPLEWSADHQRLLFTQPVAGRLQVFEVDTRDGRLRQVTRGPDAHPRGCYGPDEGFVVMAVGGTPQSPTARVLLLGGGRSQVISRGLAAHSPACASDGSAIAWVEPGARDSGRVLVKSPAIDGPVRALVPGRDPTFSPDGSWIVYSAEVAGEAKLFRVRPNGTGRSRIGRGSLAEHQPAISPDGRYVVYLSYLGVAYPVW